MDILRGGSDSSLDHLLSFIAVRRSEQCPAKVLEATDGPRVHVHASPSPAGPVQHRPHQRQAAPLPGQATDHLHSATGFPEGPLYEIGVADPLPMLLGKPEERSEVAEVVVEA